MTRFSYTALTANGETLQGTIEAHSLQTAREELRKMKLDAQELTETPMNQRSEQEKAYPKWSLDDVTVRTDDKAGSLMDPPIVVEHGSQNSGEYAPLIETVRLYAGWLLAWYILAYALGSYQLTRNLPFSIPFVEGLALSPVVFSFTLGTFLFLLLTSIHRAYKGGVLFGTLLSIIGVLGFVVYRLNV